MPWDKYNENILKQWSLMAKTYTVMHLLAANYYDKLDKWIAVLLIILGAIATSSILSSYKSQNVHVSYFNGGVVFFTTILSGISKFANVAEKQNLHNSLSYKYNSISMHIDSLLTFTRDSREEDPHDFIDSIKTALIDAKKYSPGIPKWIIIGHMKSSKHTVVNKSTIIHHKDDNYAYAFHNSIQPKISHSSSGDGTNAGEVILPMNDVNVAKMNNIYGDTYRGAISKSQHYNSSLSITPVAHSSQISHPSRQYTPRSHTPKSSPKSSPDIAIDIQNDIPEPLVIDLEDPNVYIRRPIDVKDLENIKPLTYDIPLTTENVQKLQQIYRESPIRMNAVVSYNNSSRSIKIPSNIFEVFDGDNDKLERIAKQFDQTSDIDEFEFSQQGQLDQKEEREHSSKISKRDSTVIL